MSAGQAPPVSRAVRVATVAAVVVVAAVAAVISFTHMQEVAERAGEEWRSWLLPASVDGLIVAASMILLVRRRAGLPVLDTASILAWLALLGGVAASLAANIAAAEPTVTARLIAAWPPLAFAAAFELLLQQQRPATRSTARPEPVDHPAPTPRPVVDHPGGNGAGMGLPGSSGTHPGGGWSKPSEQVNGSAGQPGPELVDRVAEPSTTPRPPVDHNPPQTPVPAASSGTAGGPSPTPEPPGDPLVDRVAALVAQSPTGRPPGRRAVARDLDVTEYRAGQLLAQVSNHNGTARKEGAR